MEEERKMKNKPRSLTSKGLIILIVALTVLVLSATVTGVYAAYTNSRHAQRTIATYDSMENRFSSNDLGEGDAKDSVKTVYTSDDEHSPSTVVTVCNYARGKQTRPSDTDITYSLSLRLVKYDPLSEARYVAVDASYISDNSLGGYTLTVRKGVNSVTLGGATLSSDTMGGTLSGGESHADAYTVTFDVDFAIDRPNLYLEMTATPDSEQLPTLTGIFKAEKRLKGATNAWTGEFADDTGSTPAEYDGFNYIITGVGSGTCTLSWDNTKVSISYVSLIELTSIDGALQTANSITFPVNSDVKARYDLQFYKVNITSENWTTMNNSVVRLEFHE